MRRARNNRRPGHVEAIAQAIAGVREHLAQLDACSASSADVPEQVIKARAACADALAKMEGTAIAVAATMRCFNSR